MSPSPRLCAFFLAAPAVLALAGCPDGSSGGTGGIQRVDRSALVTIITGDNAVVLDPHVTSDGGNVKVINQIYESLVRVDPTNVDALIPELAERWEVSPDGKTLAFSLRAGVRFHDGAPCDAAAVKLSLDRMREASELKLPSAPYASEFAHVQAIEAEGQTLKVVLDAPVARVMLRNLSMFPASIISPKTLEATRGMGPDAAANHVTQHASGTGPFKVDAFDPAAKITRLVANAEYWRGAPTVKTLVFKPVADENSRREYLERGEGHLMVDEVPRQDWAAVEASPQLTLHSWWALNLCYLGMNGKHPATKELPLRQAIALAIDREKILEHYDGTARSTHSLVAQPMGEYDPQLRPEGWADDLAQRRAKARELVKAAGAEGRSVTIYYPQQPRPYLPRPQDIADTIRQHLKEIGLDPRIQGEDKAKLFPGIPTGDYELVLIGWMTDNGDPDNFYSPLADGAEGEPSENNTSRVFDAEIHAKIVAAQQLTDAAQRVTAYREIEALLQARVAGYVPLVNTQQGLAYATSIAGIEVDGLGHYRFHKATLK